MPSEASDRGPWGPWATLALGLLVGVAFVLVQGLVAIAFGLAAGGGRPPEQLLGDGDLIAAATLASAPVCTLFVVCLAWLRRGGPRARDYLALHRTRATTVAAWIAIVLVVVVALDELTRLLDRDVVPTYMRDAYESADVSALFWLAMVVAAPVWEEVFFRGFLLTGLLRLGRVGAVLLTTVLFSVVHLQYDPVQRSMVFALGLTLALARLKTGSLYVPIAMHAFVNLVATAQTAAMA